MIVVDTSALMATVLNEPQAAPCAAILANETALAISAGTLAEALIVAARRRISSEMADLIEACEFEVVPVTAAFARRVGQAYATWGKGVHPAGLNFGDCFAYALAKERGLPLLYVGDDFAQTDMASVIPRR